MQFQLSLKMLLYKKQLPCHQAFNLLILKNEISFYTGVVFVPFNKINNYGS